MTQVTCCKCNTEYPLQLKEAAESRLPVIQCPNCGLVHTVEFHTEEILPGLELKTIRLFDYYYSEVSYQTGPLDGAIGSDADPPVKQGVAVTDWVKTNKFWLGVCLAEVGCNKTVDTSQNITLRWKKGAGGAWTTLAATGELKWAGTGNMVLTDLTPANAKAWVAQTESCALEPSADMVAQDASASLATGVGTGNYSKEFWWAIDPAGAVDGQIYYFAIYDAQSGIGTEGSPYQLDASLTIYQAPPTEKTVTGSLQPTSSTTRKYTAKRTLAANARFASALSKVYRAKRTIQGNAILTSSLAYSTGIIEKSVAGALRIVSSLTRVVRHKRIITGATTFSGQVLRGAFKKSVNGLLYFASSVQGLTRRFRAVTGSLGTSGSLERVVRHKRIISGALHLSGTAEKSVEAVVHVDTPDVEFITTPDVEWVPHEVTEAEIHQVTGSAYFSSSLQRTLYAKRIVTGAI